MRLALLVLLACAGCARVAGTAGPRAGPPAEPAPPGETPAERRARELYLAGLDAYQRRDFAAAREQWTRTIAAAPESAWAANARVGLELLQTLPPASTAPAPKR